MCDKGTFSREGWSQEGEKDGNLVDVEREMEAGKWGHSSSFLYYSSNSHTTVDDRSTEVSLPCVLAWDELAVLLFSRMTLKSMVYTIGACQQHQFLVDSFVKEISEEEGLEHEREEEREIWEHY